MIILRQKEYATGVERAMVAANKFPKPTIKQVATEKSRQQRKAAIKKINRTLGEEGLNSSLRDFIRGKSNPGKKSVGGFFRGKGTRSRVRMGQASPEAVEILRKKKVAEALRDKSTSPEAIEEKLRETLGQKAKKAGKTIVDKTKEGAKIVYVDTGRVAGKAAGAVVKHPGIAIGNIATTAGPLALPAGAYAAVQGITSATHAGTGGGMAGEWLVSDIPVRRPIRDPETGKKVRTGGLKIGRLQIGGKVERRKQAVPLHKIYGRWGRKLEKHIEGVFEGQPLKGSIKRAAAKVKESHQASHPYENKVPV